MSGLFVACKRWIPAYKIELVVFLFLLARMFKPYVPAESRFLFLIRFLALVSVLALISAATGRVYKSAGPKRQDAVLIITAFFLASYASNSVFLLDVWFTGARVFFNSFAVAGSVTSFIMVDKAKWKWLLPVYCFVCAAACRFLSFSLPSLS